MKWSCSLSGWTNWASKRSTSTIFSLLDACLNRHDPTSTRAVRSVMQSYRFDITIFWLPPSQISQSGYLEPLSKYSTISVPSRLFSKTLQNMVSSLTLPNRPQFMSLPVEWWNRLRTLDLQSTFSRVYGYCTSNLTVNFPSTENRSYMYFALIRIFWKPVELVMNFWSQKGIGF